MCELIGTAYHRNPHGKDYIVVTFWFDNPDTPGIRRKLVATVFHYPDFCAIVDAYEVAAGEEVTNLCHFDFEPWLREQIAKVEDDLVNADLKKRSS
jgi:hypothetical protein